MDFYALIAIAVGGLILVSLVLPWVTLRRVGILEAQVRQLRQQLVPPAAARPVASHPIIAAQPIPETRPVETVTPVIPKPPAEPVSRPGAASLEQRFASRLPVWIGGVSLALAGLFMVKYSIENHLLSETTRVVLGSLFGLGLLYAGHAIFRRGTLANGTRIAQALVGAGIADLYGCLVAASSLYHLLPSSIGFFGMAVLTAYAVARSLRYGAPIALLGLAGGFLTPILINSDTADVPALFIYLYLVVAGIFFIVRRQGWWSYGLLAVASAFSWVLLWFFTTTTLVDDGLWPALFLLAVAATIAAASREALESLAGDKQWATRPVALVNYLAVGGATLLMGLVLRHVAFSPLVWGMLGLLSAGGIFLAALRPRIYAFAPVAALALNFGLLTAWPGEHLLTLGSFALLFAGAGYYLLWRTSWPLLWASLCAAAALGYYLLAYDQLHVQYAVGIYGLPVFGSLGLLLAGLAVYATTQISTRFAEEAPHRQMLLAISAGTATAFLALALAIVVSAEFLPLALMGEVLALAWIKIQVRVESLRWFVAGLAVIFALLLFPQIVLLIQLTFYSLFELKLDLQPNLPLVNKPLLQLGLPALLLAGASWFLRQDQDDRLVKSLEAGVLVLLGITGYYLMRHAFHAGQNILFTPAEFIERGTITAALLLYGLACLLTGRYLQRQAVLTGGLAIGAVALFRLCYFDLLLDNPLWSHQFVGSLPLVNGLLLTYGLPILVFWGAARQLAAVGRPGYGAYLEAFSLFLLFVLVSLNIRQFYQGGYLNSAATASAEIYIYSLAWLGLGLGFLLAGTMRVDKILRYASLLLLLLTAGKVFLYDAGALTGLYRIFSFLGLGFGLLGLGWFYTRFVFTDRGGKT